MGKNAVFLTDYKVNLISMLSLSDANLATSRKLLLGEIFILNLHRTGG